MRVYISHWEIGDRLSLSRKRLLEAPYDIDSVFSPDDAEWPGDREGRALLAFVCLAEAGEEKIPCMDRMLGELPERMNEKGYLGPVSGSIFEQQLSGHSWLLRGLCEYYENFGGDGVYGHICRITENLYLPLAGKIKGYPSGARGVQNGGVDGHSVGEDSGWILSSDTCCAFMSIDGLSHAYKVTGDRRILDLLGEMTDTFMKIDKRAIHAQTHCTLTAGRGMMRLYALTGERKYLDGAREIMDLYSGYGMTYTFENYNWWGYAGTWTEPCAVIDSMMLALDIYKATGTEDYRRLAARICHNGFASIQRPNGGAGTQTIVCGTQPELKIIWYEAACCCSMRMAEGLRYLKENKNLLYAEITGHIRKDDRGVYRDGDIIYAETVGDVSHRLHPLIKYYTLTDDEANTLSQRVVFDT